jgi:transcription antitermination factor NusG
VATDKRGRVREPRQKSEAATPPEASAPPEAPVLPARAPLPFPRTPLRSSSSSSTPAEVPRELAPGVRVQVAGGSFLGRLGVVQSVDAAKGQARVLFGLLAASIATSDLVVVRAPGKRPRLSSSHRRLPPSKE